MMSELGYWDSVLWFFVFLAFFLLAVFLTRGKKRESKSFLCGMDFDAELEKGDFFYSFSKNFEKYFSWLKKLHSGVLNHAVEYFVFYCLAIVLLLVFQWGSL